MDTGTSYRDYESPLPAINWASVADESDLEALSFWVYALGDHDWQGAPGELPPPIRYERIYFNSPEREKWLNALETLLRRAIPFLYDEGQFAVLSQHLPFETRPEQLHQMLVKSLWAADRLKSWIRLRRESAIEQFIKALGTVYADVDYGPDSEFDVDDESKIPVKIGLHPDWDEQERLLGLLRMFEVEIQKTAVSASLRVAAHRLEALANFPLEDFFTEISYPNAIINLNSFIYFHPGLTWLNLDDFKTPNKLESDFIQDFRKSLGFKIGYAKVALGLVLAALGENAVLQHSPSVPIGAYPWTFIEEIAEEIELRSKGRFMVVDKNIQAACAGFIIALKEVSILPKEKTLPTLYEAFSAHYNCKIGSDRDGPIRQLWKSKAIKALAKRQEGPSLQTKVPN
ncbi:hypothetical protein GCM10011375_12400 [Hymenobacter qilianensis]|uniref:Uncharacterized protein n=2 Tax=Hymenobacter qilianensis TaxID=1385715 RepID=A0ACB5PPJ9_9BACT|nr:hypothetical protein [Hymenobacter qilianensis]QNP53203.1 hypothetical protein H9L05_06090 [Hymenobacter qilianensis]GGF58738.1 hypothetical protein GCM10011375_12400 [Hymenobacter qilianensis]